MKRPITLLASLFLALLASGRSDHHTGRIAERIQELRSAGASFGPVSLFTAVERSEQSEHRWSRALQAAHVLRLDHAATSALLASRSRTISLSLPEGSDVVILDLERVDITPDDFQVTLASTGGAATYDEGVHYQGAIRGEPGSMAAISIFADEVMGIMSDAGGERILGRFADDTQGDHVFYHERDLLGTSGRSCHASPEDMGEPMRPGDVAGDDRTVKCVRLYWEVNYDIFQGKGSVTAAANYVTGLFNQTAILYANDGISVTLSQVFVWDVPSPYTSTSTSTQLSTFGSTRTSFNGDLAHLLGYTGNGGVAWLNTICSSQTQYRMAYSDINSTYQNVPVYSWSVEVVTHEQGHNMGSPHTHACSWNGNNTAIDGCGPVAGYSEGSCAQGPVPSSSVGGTIMSYCHLTSSGINFSNGFGPQPAALIIGKINAGACLVNCSTTTCSPPTNLLANQVTSTSASLSWTAASGSTGHSLQWRPTTSTTWTTVDNLTGTTYSLTGLTAGTSYQFQVRTLCGTSGSSSYAAPVGFTTAAAACGIPTGSSAGSITATSAVLAWTAVTGATGYNLQWRPASASTWTTISSITGTSFTLTGLFPATGYQFQVRSVCASGNSSYASPVSFTTSALSCTDVYEPNNSRNNGRTLQPGALVTGLIASQYDQDWFRFANSSSAPNIRVSLTGLPANYSLTIYRGSTIVGSSNVAGTGNEQVILNAAAVASDYSIRVIGVSGAFNATSCYTLSVQTSALAFMPSAGMSEEIAVADAHEASGLIGALYPNPARDAFTLEWPESAGPIEVELMDALGRPIPGQVMSTPSGSTGMVVPVVGLPAGLYLVRVSSFGHSEVRRLVIGR